MATGEVGSLVYPPDSRSRGCGIIRDSDFHLEGDAPGLFAPEQLMMAAT